MSKVKRELAQLREQMDRIVDDCMDTAEDVSLPEPARFVARIVAKRIARALEERK